MAPDLGAVVILDPAFIGDVVFDGPLVRAIRARAPDARVGLVVRPPADAIARRMVGVSRVHRYDKYRADRGLGGLRRLAEELAGEAYQLALIPHPSLRTTLLARVAGIPTRVGNAPWPARLLLTAHHAASDTHVRRRLALFDPDASPELQGTLQRATSAAGAPRVALLLGANWATKRWPIDEARALTLALAADGLSIVLLGSDEERPLAAELMAQLPAGAPVEDAMGGSLDELLDRLGRCSVVVGGDTGPAHAARALGVPTVLLFGPTPEGAHDVARSERALAVPVPCRPCSAHGPAVCPLGHHRCMRELDAARVHRAVRELLVH